MEKFDFKKEYKDLYQPKTKPSIVEVPEMCFIAIDGKGDPNTCGEYKEALEILYGLSFTIKMSKMSGTQPEGYFEYVVPPLEGLWYVDDAKFDGTNITDKNRFCWTSMIRQPDFITEDMAYAALERIKIKKPHHMYEKIIFDTIHDGKCVEILHTGSYDNEPFSFEQMDKFAEENGLQRISDSHREIYLTNRTKADKLKTILRYKVN